MKKADGFTLHRAARITHVSLETLKNWQRNGFLVPSLTSPEGVGRYSFRDLLAVRVAVQLRQSGVTLQALRKVVEYLRESKKLSTSDALASSVLVTDGHDVYELGDGSVILSTLRKPGQTAFNVNVVMLREVIAEVERDVLAPPMRRRRRSVAA